MEENKKKGNGFGRKGWAIIIFTLFIYMFTCTCADTLNVSVGVFSAVYGWDSNQMLMFSAVGGFVGIVISLILGFIVARKGVKWPTVVFLFAFAAIWFFHGQVKTLGSYAVAVVLLTAFANTLNLVSTQQIMSNWFPRKKGIALGWATIGTCFSSAIMVAVFQGLFGKGIAAPYNLMTVIIVIMAIVMIVWFKSYPEEAGAYPDNEPMSDAERAKVMELITNYKSEFTIGKLFRTKELYMLALIWGFVALGLVANISQMIPRLCAVGISQNMAILWLTIASVIGIPASVIWGFIDQKIGTNLTTKIFVVLWTVMLFLTGLGSALVSPMLSSVTVVCYALLLGGMMNLMPSSIIQVFGRYDFAQANKIIMPAVIGIRSFAFLIVPMMLAMSGPDVNVGYRNAFILCTILSAIAAVLALALKNKCIGKVVD